MIVTGVIRVIVTSVIVRFSLLLARFSLHPSLVQKLLERSFTTLHMNSNTIVLGSVRAHAVTKVGNTAFIENDVWFDQREMRSAAAFIGGCAAMTWETHKK